MQTLSVGGRPLRLKGTIKNPGVEAIVALELWAESVPIEEPLLKAFKPEVQKVVGQFEPKGTVRAHATVAREPMAGHPEGHLTIDAEIDLSERCEIRWAKLPYPIRNLTGRLELHPDLWIFRNMRGENGQAKITASGRVEKLPGDKLPNGDEPLKVHVDLQAKNLPFSQELRTALPRAWDKTWKTINPSGASDVEATVEVEPHKPDRTHIVIVPLPESSVRLEIARAPQPKHFDPGGMVELRMDDVRGRFVFDNGTVTMSDVSVQFRGAPVRCDHGTVFVEDSGRFDLSVTDLWVKDIRLDLDLRKKMPPLMAQFAQRLDDGRTFTARGNLKIGWSGIESQPAWCQWDKTLVVFNDNRLSTGIPLEHIQGELNNVSGFSNGLTVTVEGIIKLESVVMMGQQITKVESPFRVRDGVAELVDMRGDSWAATCGARAGSVWMRLLATRRRCRSMAPGSRSTRGRSADAGPSGATSTPGSNAVAWAATSARSKGKGKLTSPRATWVSCRSCCGSHRCSIPPGPCPTLREWASRRPSTPPMLPSPSRTDSPPWTRSSSPATHSASRDEVLSTPRPTWISASVSSSGGIASPSRS